MSGEKGLGLKSWISGPGRKGTEKSAILDHRRVAVLPFASMSPNPDDEYFADGMTEEVISTLSHVPGIEVISRTSVMQYKKNPRSLKEVSRELGVGTILEGGVRKAGNHLRITVQMIDATKDRNVWSESYDRELHDVFAIQSEVASRVVNALKIKPDRSEIPTRKKPTASTEAYTLYLKGRFHWNKRGLDDIKTALDYFERAVREDSRFAEGYVGMADCHELLAANWHLDQYANREKAKSMVAKALALEPNMAEAYATKGLILTCEFKLREAAEELKKALVLNPNYAPAHLWYFQILLAQKNYEKAREQIETAVMLDPLSTNMMLNYGSFYAVQHDYPAGLAMIKKAVELDPSFATGHVFLAGVYAMMNMSKDAQTELDKVTKILEKVYPRIELGNQATMAYFEDNKVRLRKLLPELEANMQESFTDSLSIGSFYFRLGDLDRGFEWFEKAYSSQDSSLMSIPFDPFLPENVRADPRYGALLKKMQLN